MAILPDSYFPQMILFVDPTNLGLEIAVMPPGESPMETVHLNLDNVLKLRDYLSDVIGILQTVRT